VVASGAGRRVAGLAATEAVHPAAARRPGTPAGVAPGVDIAVRALQAAATPAAAVDVPAADVLAVAMPAAGAADTPAVAAAGDTPAVAAAGVMTEARVAVVVSGSAQAAVRGAKRLPTVLRADPTVQVGIRDVRAAAGTRAALEGAAAATKAVLPARAAATKVALPARAAATKVVLPARAAATKVVRVGAAGPAAIRVGRAAAATKAVQTVAAAAGTKVARVAAAAGTKVAHVAAAAGTKVAQAAVGIRAVPPAAAADTKVARAAGTRAVPRVAPRSALTVRHSQLAATEPSEVGTAAKGAPAVGFNGLTVRDLDHRGARMAPCGVGSPEAAAVTETAPQDHGNLRVGDRGAMTMTRTSVREGQAVRRPPQRASAVT
jgi:hypothetical protein